jgi:hypothetical protein
VALVVTDVAVPKLQRLLEGGVENVPPLDDPQVPFTTGTLVAEQLTAKESLPVQVQVKVVSPVVTEDAVP